MFQMSKKAVLMYIAITRQLSYSDLIKCQNQPSLVMYGSINNHRLKNSLFVTIFDFKLSIKSAKTSYISCSLKWQSNVDLDSND